MIKSTSTTTTANKRILAAPKQRKRDRYLASEAAPKCPFSMMPPKRQVSHWPRPPPRPLPSIWWPNVPRPQRPVPSPPWHGTVNSQTAVRRVVAMVMNSDSSVIPRCDHTSISSYQPRPVRLVPPVRVHHSCPSGRPTRPHRWSRWQPQCISNHLARHRRRRSSHVPTRMSYSQLSICSCHSYHSRQHQPRRLPSPSMTASRRQRQLRSWLPHHQLLHTTQHPRHWPAPPQPQWPRATMLEWLCRHWATTCAIAWAAITAACAVWCHVSLGWLTL